MFDVFPPYCVCVTVVSLSFFPSLLSYSGYLRLVFVLQDRFTRCLLRYFHKVFVYMVVFALRCSVPCLDACREGAAGGWQRAWVSCSGGQLQAATPPLEHTLTHTCNGHTCRHPHILYEATVYAASI